MAFTNARIVGGRALIPLLPRWAVLFHGVKTFGPVVSLSRNRCAALARMGAYPEVLSTPCGQRASGGDGDLRFFFPSWARAFVTIEEQPEDWLYAAEFQGPSGDLIHKVFLTSESDFEAFRCWVGINCAANPAEDPTGEARWPSCVEDPAVPCEGETCFLSKERFLALLCEVIEWEVSVRISVGNAGLVQTVKVAPNRLREDNGLVSLGDDETGLQFQASRLAEVSLQQTCDPAGWILRAYEPEGFPACAIEPLEGEASEAWRRLLARIIALRA